MVFEYAEYDLWGLIEYHNQDAVRRSLDPTFSPTVALKEAHVKCYMKQLCEGKGFFHDLTICNSTLMMPCLMKFEHHTM